MKIIGLTGPSGSGKSALAQLLSERGVAVIDADIVSREVVMPGTQCLKLLAQSFGEQIIKPTGELDRKALGGIVFSDRESLKRLNCIIHPFIVDRINERIEQQRQLGTKYLLLDAPQLFEAGADRLCDITVAVTAPRAELVARIMQRDGLTESEAERRLDNALGTQFFTEHCDVTLQNNGGAEQLAAAAEQIMSLLEKSN